MKLQGEVEVFKVLSDGSNESVIKENNMVVDGASELIVDMLTTPYSIKYTGDLMAGGGYSNSASLDPSNFMVVAVSLGKAEKLYGGHPDTSAADTNVIGMHGFFNNIGLSTVYTTCCSHDPDGSPPGTDQGCDDFYGARAVQAGVSSFISSFELPKDPTPRDIALEKSSKTQIELYHELSAFGTAGIPENTTYTRTFGSASGWNDASNLIPSKGHNYNAQYGRSNKSAESMYQGCYAPSDGIDVYIWKPQADRATVAGEANPGNALLVLGVQASAPNAGWDPVTEKLTVAAVSGRYNTMGSMDKSGFLVAYPVQHHPASGDLTKGAAVSACSVSSLTNIAYNNSYVTGSSLFLENPGVCYSFTVSSSDLLALAAFKGVTNIGLWSLDRKETFKTEAAPVAWDAPSNNRKYKLFAKKVFSEDLTHIKDRNTLNTGIRSYVNLLVEWRMNFHFGESFTGLS